MGSNGDPPIRHIMRNSFPYVVAKVSSVVKGNAVTRKGVRWGKGSHG